MNSVMVVATRVGSAAIGKSAAAEEWARAPRRGWQPRNAGGKCPDQAGRRPGACLRVRVAGRVRAGWRSSSSSLTWGAGSVRSRIAVRGRPPVRKRAPARPVPLSKASTKVVTFAPVCADTHAHGVCRQGRQERLRSKDAPVFPRLLSVGLTRSRYAIRGDETVGRNSAIPGDTHEFVALLPARTASSATAPPITPPSAA